MECYWNVTDVPSELYVIEKNCLSGKILPQKFHFPFPLLADEDKEVINAFGVWGAKKFLGRIFDGINRTTFIIDEKGIIEEVISDVKTKSHTAQILK